MRVGLVTPYSWSVPGGVNEHVANLAAQLEREGHDTWVLAPTSRALDVRSQWRLPDGKFISLGSAMGFRSNGSTAHVSPYPFMLQRMDHQLKRERFDVLHVHEPCAPAVSAAATLRSPYPTVGTFHAALDRSLLYGSLSLLVKRAMEHLDVRIAVSGEAARYLEMHYPGAYQIVPNGVDVEAYAPARQIATTDGRILFIGRAEPRKGLDVLLRAFEHVRREMPRADLGIVGAPKKQVIRLSEAIYELGTPPSSVHPLGRVDFDTKIEQMGQAAVLCAPSLEGESFGVVLIEALAAGLPVVASDLPGYRAVLGDGRYGLLVPPNDPEALARALIRVLRDGALRRRLAAAGAVAVAQYSWREVARSVLSAYEEAIEQSPATAFRPKLTREPRIKRQREADRVRVRA